MPEILDKETKEILDELEGEGHKMERPDKPEEEVEPSKPVDEEKEEPEVEPETQPEKPEEKEEEPEDEPEKPEKPKREPTLMPVWKHKVALEKLNKELEDARKGTRPSEAKPEVPAEPEQPVKDEDLDALAKELEADPAVVRKIVDAVAKRATPTMPKEVSELLQSIPKLREVIQTYESQAANQAFDSEFDQHVKALVEAEYPGLSTAQVASIKSKLKDWASTEEYIKTPLKVIYRGLDDFRGLVKVKKATAEDGGKGPKARQPATDFDNLTEAQVKDLSEDDFDKYSAYMEAKEKSKRK